MGWLDLVPPAPARRSSWLDDVPDAETFDLGLAERKRKKLAELAKAKLIGDQQAGELGIGAESDPLAYAGSALKEFTAAPFVGLAEGVGLVPEGSRAKIRSEYQTERDRFLSANPSTGGAVASYALDVLGAAPNALIPGVAGKGVAMGAKALGAGSALTKLAGALGGAGEAAALSFGDVVDQPTSTKAAVTGIGALAGTLGGRAVGKAVAAKESAKVPFLTRMFDPKRGQPDFIANKKLAAQGAVDQADFYLGRKMDEVEREIRKVTGLFDGKERAEMDRLIRQSLEGDEAAFNLLPEHVQGPVKQIRGHQDLMSHNFISTMMGGDENAGLLKSAISNGADSKSLSMLIAANDPERIALAAANLPESALDDALILKGNVEAMAPWRRETAKKFASEAATFEFNMGKYLNRSYRGFSDPRYAQELRKQGEQSWRYSGFKSWYQTEFGKSPEEADAAAKGLISQMENLFANPRPNELRGNSLLPPINLDALKHRNDITPEVQAFLGLETDWKESIRRGSLKAATMAEFTEAYNSMLDDGIQRGVFDVVPEALGVTAKNPKLSATLGSAGRFNLPPGYTIKTSPEINAALTLAEKVSEDNWFHAINAITNANLTKRSLSTSARNVMANPLIGAATGHPYEISKGYAKAMTDIGNLDLMRELGGVPVLNKADEAEISEWVKRGVLEVGGSYGNVSTGLGKLTKPGGVLSEGPAKFVGAPTTKDKAKEALRSVFRKEERITTEMYHTPDQGLRLAAARAIAKKLASIYGNSKTTSEIFDMAAERAKAKIPTPSLSYPIVNTLRKNVPVGPFAMFPAEILRSVVNNLDIARKDVIEGLATGNSELRNYGLQQFAGVVGTIGTLAAMPKAIRYVAGAGETTKEKEAAAQHMAPSFYENSQIVLLPSGDPDKMRYMDFGGLNPFGILFRPVAAMANSIEANDGVFEATVAGMKEFVEPFLSAKIPVQIAAELYQNRKTSYGGGPGSRIYNESDTGLEKAKSVGSYLSRTGVVPKAIAQVKDALKAKDMDSLIRLVGITIREESVADAMSKRAKFQHGETYKNVRSIVTKVTGPAERSRQRPDPTALAEAKARANQQWTEEGYKALMQDIGAMRTWGKTDPEIFRILTQDTGLPQYVIRGALLGQNVGLQF